METKTCKRDWKETTARWMFIGGCSVLMLCVFSLSPAIYILGMMLLAMMAIIGLVATAVVRLTSTGNMFDALLAGEIVRGCFQTIGSLLIVLASSSD